MMRFGLIRSPAFLMGLLLCVWGCGGSRDPVEQLQKSLATAPDYMIILEDMQEEGTFFTSYHHRYKVVQGERQGVTDWIEVPESVYRKYEAFLGMALAAKTNEGLTDTPHPAGYAAVGNPHYGQWQQRGGQSFWVFYGQYALMRDMMGWGGRSVYRNDYDDYRNTRQQRRPYYGRNREYGTAGSLTKKQRPTFFERRKQAIARRKSSFAQKVQSRTGRSRSSFGGRTGGFGK